MMRSSMRRVENLTKGDSGRYERGGAVSETACGRSTHSKAARFCTERYVYSYMTPPDNKHVKGDSSPASTNTNMGPWSTPSHTQRVHSTCSGRTSRMHVEHHTIATGLTGLTITTKNGRKQKRAARPVPAFAASSTGE